MTAPCLDHLHRPKQGPVTGTWVRTSLLGGRHVSTHTTWRPSWSITNSPTRRAARVTGSRGHMNLRVTEAHLRRAKGWGRGLGCQEELPNGIEEVGSAERVRVSGRASTLVPTSVSPAEEGAVVETPGPITQHWGQILAWQGGWAGDGGGHSAQRLTPAPAGSCWAFSPLQPA